MRPVVVRPRVRIWQNGGCVTKMLDQYEATFHQWGCDCVEGETGFGNYTVAIVERADGTVEKVIPGIITFTDKEAPNETESL